MICKLVSYGPRRYIKNAWNVFDGIIVTVSIFDAILELGNWRHKTMGASVFRSFRLVRNFSVLES